jgi:hypothetical protein
MSTKKEGANNAQAEEQTRTATDFKKELERQLQELSRKKQLADRREIFINKKQHLNEYLEKIAGDTETGNFESVDARLSFIVKSGGYRDEEQFSISIMPMIENHVKRLIEDIDKAITKIEAELLA